MHDRAGHDRHPVTPRSLRLPEGVVLRDRLTVLLHLLGPRLQWAHKRIDRRQRFLRQANEAGASIWPSLGSPVLGPTDTAAPARCWRATDHTPPGSSSLRPAAQCGTSRTASPRPTSSSCSPTSPSRPRPPAKRIVLHLDNAGWRGPRNLAVPDGIRLVFQPAYSPELQPAEHLWAFIDEPLVNRHFDTIRLGTTPRCNRDKPQWETSSIGTRSVPCCRTSGVGYCHGTARL